ncbi:hypothetical protein SJAV_15630 [Sulfurisphaera javensis]|uniref:Uncharacterized protein n=1 Tax=Sulfurisphaera javensis TaxID=2049879 RepID=A0AAT9GRS9_9CREN
MNPTEMLLVFAYTAIAISVLGAILAIVFRIRRGE